MTTFIDTCFVTALVNETDEHHALAEKLSQALEGQRMLTTDAVLLEVGNGLAKRFRTAAVEVIERLTNAPDVEVARLDPEVFEAAFALFKSYQDKEWGLVDCVSFVVMRERGVTRALTFDRHFVQAGFQALMREEGE